MFNILKYATETERGLKVIGINVQPFIVHRDQMMYVPRRSYQKPIHKILVLQRKK